MYVKGKSDTAAYFSSTNQAATPMCSAEQITFTRNISFTAVVFHFLGKIWIYRSTLRTRTLRRSPYRSLFSFFPKLGFKRFWSAPVNLALSRPIVLDILSAHEKLQAMQTYHRNFNITEVFNVGSNMKLELIARTRKRTTGTEEYAGGCTISTTRRGNNR